MMAWELHAGERIYLPRVATQDENALEPVNCKLVMQTCDANCNHFGGLVEYRGNDNKKKCAEGYWKQQVVKAPAAINNIDKGRYQGALRGHSYFVWGGLKKVCGLIMRGVPGTRAATSRRATPLIVFSNA